MVLGEIASRALSPAVNDPGAAIAVIEAGTRVLAAMRRHEPEPDWSPPAGVIVPPLAFPDLIEDLFRPAARDGAGTIEVGIRLQKALAALQAIDEDAGPDCAGEARDALDRAQTAFANEQDAARQPSSPACGLKTQRNYPENKRYRLPQTVEKWDCYVLRLTLPIAMLEAGRDDAPSLQPRSCASAPPPPGEGQDRWSIARKLDD